MKCSGDASATSAAQFPDTLLARDRPRACVSTSLCRSAHRGWFLSILIPEEYGGLGLGVTEASIVLEEINRSGGNSAAFHAQMYLMGTLLRHGSDAQKDVGCPPSPAASCGCRHSRSPKRKPAPIPPVSGPLLGVRARHISSNGHKNWTSRIEQSDLLLLLARTTSREAVNKRTEGLSLFLIDLRECTSAKRGTRGAACPHHVQLRNLPSLVPRSADAAR